MRPSCAGIFRPKNRGRGECRVLGAPAAPCATKKHRGRSHRYTGTPGIPARNGFTAYFALSPGTGLFCPRHLADICVSGPPGPTSHSAKLDASVGASGPHDFAVRKLTPSSEAPLASTASRPASVTIAIRPSVGWDSGVYATDLGQAASTISEIQKLFPPPPGISGRNATRDTRAKKNAPGGISRPLTGPI